MMNTMQGQCILTILLILIMKGDCYKILALYGFASKSHLNAFVPVLNELVNRGHEVTIFQPYLDLKVDPRIKMLHSFDVMPLKEAHSKSLFQENQNGNTIFSFISPLEPLAVLTARSCLASPNLKSLLKAGKQFDIVLVSFILNEYGFALAPLLGNYTIYHASGSIPGFFTSPAPMPYASVPNLDEIPLPPVMTFWQRLTNAYFSIVQKAAYDYHLLPSVEKTVKEFVSNAPSISSTINNQISLYLINYDMISGIPKPTVPNIVSITCPHCREAKPLPQNLEEFISSSGDAGFIMFGLGSHAQSRHFPEKLKKTFLSAFARLQQKVIWKFEDDSLKPPSNVYIMKWMPQQDLLAHPKLRLFITHGGMLSLQEASYHGVPVIGIPLFADQPSNIANIVAKGLGGQLHLHNITSESVYEEINKILTDHKYAQNMKRASHIMKDHAKGATQSGADWIEYVARHDGAWHLRTQGQDMNYVQYFLIDIILTITISSFALVLLIVSLFRVVIKKLTKKKQKTT